MIDEARYSHDITQTGLKNRLARRLAMQVLFVWDAAGRPDDAEAAHVTADATAGIDPSNEAVLAEAHEARQRALGAARGVWAQWEWINAALERIAPQWPPRRMPAVDRAILRLAVWELNSTPTPAAVILDEAIELAKEFSTADSPRFVNGVLDAVLREREQLLGGSETLKGGSREVQLPSTDSGDQQLTTDN